MLRQFLYFAVVFTFSSVAFAQSKTIKDVEQQYINWHNKDLRNEAIMGTSVDKAYLEIIPTLNRKPKTIIVAVMDSGVDIFHEDLRENIWTNEDEIPDNGIDDDQNGYIDDYYGWNFIGNKAGENIYYETLEYTRLVAEDMKDFEGYDKAVERLNSEIEKKTKESKNIEEFTNVFYKAKAILKDKTGVDVTGAADLEMIKSNDNQVLAAKNFLKGRYEAGLTEEKLEQYTRSIDERLKYHLNVNYKPREIVGDNPRDINDRDYGNNDVKGPRSDHGTAVAGVIGAVRNNDLGMNGIASSVKIMSVRTTPMGDERDKDVALGIYYAVDNGADIINMSFGKEFSPEKEFVDAAVKYAESKGVLIVHGSGNDGTDIDKYPHYPSDIYNGGVEAANWINVGASDWLKDKSVAATFSNYGAAHVDIFAPGVNIVSTDTANSYGQHDGTSLASPVVAGVAALVLSYYPELTPDQLIDVLMSSAYKVKKPKMVMKPLADDEDKSKVKFKTLSKSGGIVNAYDALKEAQKRYKENL